MNILMMGSSLDKLIDAYPEDLGEGFSLSDSEKMGTVVKFNHRGNLIAIGCFDGSLRVYDYDTLSLISHITIIESLPISAIEWFKDYRYILVACSNTVFICDIIERRCIKKFSMSSPLIRTYICPSNESLILCCTVDNPPFLVNWQTDERKQLPIKLHEYKVKRRDCVGGLFTPCGKYIFIGNTVGHIIVVNTETLRIVPFQSYPPDLPFHISEDVNIDLKSKQVVTNKFYFIVQLEFSKNGGYIAVNTRMAIHVFKVEFDKKNGEQVNFIKIKEFKNAIMHENYSLCSFLNSTMIHNDSSYLLATNGSKVLIYEYIVYGELVKILECPYNESITSLTCHPQNFKYIRPVVVTATNGANILFWTKHVVENWSAFSPDFDEIDCNELYIERENEYDDDCENEFKTALYPSSPEDESEIIDIFAKPSDMKMFQDEHFYIPTIPSLPDDAEKVIFEKNKGKTPVRPKKKRPTKPPAKKKKTNAGIEDSDSDYEDD